MVAQRHCSGAVVTASIDQMSFREPIHVGDHVILKASVNYVGTTSLEIGVQVTKEDPRTGQLPVRATTAYLTFVHIDDKGHPLQVPPIRPETEEEKKRYENAKLRVQARKELIKRMHK